MKSSERIFLLLLTIAVFIVPSDSKILSVAKTLILLLFIAIVWILVTNKYKKTHFYCGYYTTYQHYYFP
jgi:hypothetical protein